MKICRYCGTEYDDSLDKCPNCGGNKVFSARELEEEANQQQIEMENQERAAAAPVRKKNALIGVIVAVVVVIAAIAGFFIYKANQPLSNGMTKDEAQGIFDNGVAYMDAGQYEDAINIFLQLPTDSKKYVEAQELILQSQDSYRADIVNRVNSQITNKDFSSAFDLVGKAQSVLPGDTELQGAYDSICTAYRTDILSRVDSQVANGNYESAFSLIGEAQSILPGDSELQGAYDNTYSAYRTAVLAKADEYSQSGQYKMALEYLNGVQTTFADDAQIQDAYDNINLAYKEQVRTTALTDADKYVASADYVSAINMLNSATAEIGQDEEVAAKLNIVSNDYTASVIDAAKAQYIEYNADSIYTAENMLGQALGVLPGNEALSSELAFYENHEPIPLLSLADAEQSYNVSLYKFNPAGSITDTSDQVHENAIAPDDWFETSHPYGWSPTYSSAHWSWFLDYQYSKITGELFFDKKYRDALVEVELTITTSSGTENKWVVTNSSGAVNFIADLTGSKNVELELHQNEIGNTFAYLSDIYVWK